MRKTTHRPHQQEKLIETIYRVNSLGMQVAILANGVNSRIGFNPESVTGIFFQLSIIGGLQLLEQLPTIIEKLPSSSLKNKSLALFLELRHWKEQIYLRFFKPEKDNSKASNLLLAGIVGSALNGLDASLINLTVGALGCLLGYAINRLEQQEINQIRKNKILRLTAVQGTCGGIYLGTKVISSATLIQSAVKGSSISTAVHSSITTAFNPHILLLCLPIALFLGYSAYKDKQAESEIRSKQLRLSQLKLELTSIQIKIKQLKSKRTPNKELRQEEIKMGPHLNTKIKSSQTSPLSTSTFLNRPRLHAKSNAIDPLLKLKKQENQKQAKINLLQLEIATLTEKQASRTKTRTIILNFINDFSTGSTAVNFLFFAAPIIFKCAALGVLGGHIGLCIGLAFGLGWAFYKYYSQKKQNKQPSLANNPNTVFGQSKPKSQDQVLTTQNCQHPISFGIDG